MPRCPLALISTQQRRPLLTVGCRTIFDSMKVLIATQTESHFRALLFHRHHRHGSHNRDKTCLQTLPTASASTSAAVFYWRSLTTDVSHTFRLPHGTWPTAVISTTSPTEPASPGLPKGRKFIFQSHTVRKLKYWSSICLIKSIYIIIACVDTWAAF